MSQRPLSPHLSIYKPQITSASSIIGRICGVYTYALIMFAFWAVIVATYKYSNPFLPFYVFIMQIQIASPLISVISYIFVFVSVFCVTFYSGTLIRHIFWDYNTFLSLKAASIFGYLIIAFSVLVSVVSVSLLAIR